MYGLIVDNFAGGGGASLGIENGCGRFVDYAINHDSEAIAMHRANHPNTIHLCEDVYHVSPKKLCNGRHVAFVWLSPDCKHFSRAKGGKPVERGIRGLAWVGVRWAKEARPDILVLENVPEFVDWGPLLPDNTPDPKKKGLTFKKFTGNLRGLGYKVEWKELVAADYGAPTTRKRLFLIARCDGFPIVWPEPTHRNPKKPANLLNYELPLWRAAYECINWDDLGSSIFGRKKDLAENTLTRVCVGLDRFLFNDPKPFLVANTTGNPPTGVDEPMKTATTGNHHMLVAPTIVPVSHAGGENRVSSVKEPVKTVTGAHRGEMALVAPLLTEHANASGQRVFSVKEPLRTQCAQVKGGHFAVIAPHLTKFRSGSVGSRMGDPVPTVTGNSFVKRAGGAAPIGLVVPTLIQTGYGEREGQAPRVPGLDKPLGTVVAGGTKHALISAFVAKHYGDVIGHDMERPLGTVTAVDHHSVVAASIEKMHGTGVGADARDPLPTVLAGGKHLALSSYLVKYYGNEKSGESLKDPMDTVTVKDRLALVTLYQAGFDLSAHQLRRAKQVARLLLRKLGAKALPHFVWVCVGKKRFPIACVELDGELAIIWDILIRMLQPRELARAQGFPDSYVLPGTKTSQVARIGNSVCPPVAEAIVRANLGRLDAARVVA